jgi:hypothetical protein
MRQCGSALCFAFLLTMSCRDVRDLFALGAALNRQYPDSRVSVSLTDGLILTVTVSDSAFAAASCERQTAVATRIATFVHGNSGGFDSLGTIGIAFAPPRSGGGTTAGAGGLPFRFAWTQLSTGLTPTDSTRAVESCKTWRELQ